MNEELLIEKLKEIILTKIKTHPYKGRPYSFTNEKLIEGIFYVLKNGVTWKVASKMTFGNYTYRSTLNRRFNELINENIIAHTYKEIVGEYISNNNIKELIIDSMDTINGNCNKKYLYKSHKLHKQAVRTSIICTKDRIPLAYQNDPAYNHDSKLGFQLAQKLNINDGKIHYLIGDKGYFMKKSVRQILLNENKFRLVVPKRRYKRKKRKSKCKKERTRYSKQMEQSLKLRIRVEHSNSILHRSWLSIIYDKSMKTFNSFIELAIICIIINDTIKININ